MNFDDLLDLVCALPSHLFEPAGHHRVFVRLTELGKDDTDALLHTINTDTHLTIFETLAGFGLLDE